MGLVSRSPVDPPLGVCRDSVELCPCVLHLLPDSEDGDTGGDGRRVLHDAARPVHGPHVSRGPRVPTEGAFGASSRVGRPTGDHLAPEDTGAVRNGVDDTAGPHLLLADVDEAEPGGGVHLRHALKPPDPRPLASQALVGAPEVDLPAEARPGGSHRQQVLKNKTRVKILIMFI